MEADKPKFNPVNWNAGSEFNDLIKSIKENYIMAEINQDYYAALTTLSTDFDFSYQKIRAEAKKQNKDVRKKAKRIRAAIDNAINFIHTKKNFPNFQSEIIKKLNKIKRVIWDLQGEYGVLYPYEEEKQDMSGMPTPYVNKR